VKHFEALELKIMSLAQLVLARNKWASENQKVVFTNGCFDILHFGHIHYLADAADCGDKLIVGLNSDSSVSALKGPSRPINDIMTRKTLLSSLSFVDAVIVFEKATPLELIQELTPDVLVKGGDWETSQIIGSDWVLQHGGEVLSLPFIEGYSTTSIETKIKNS
jgi:rfaE bifunctional protein nucleotidyltransferase chain/domain